MGDGEIINRVKVIGVRSLLLLLLLFGVVFVLIMMTMGRRRRLVPNSSSPFSHLIFLPTLLIHCFTHGFKNPIGCRTVKVVG